MTGRLLLGGIAWLAAIFLFAAALMSPAPERHAAPTWSVTQSRTAHHAMIVDVVAQHVSEAKAIASEIVESTRGRGHEEVLVYVRGPGEDGKPAARRVQWTPRGGFVELVISD